MTDNYIFKVQEYDDLAIHKSVKFVCTDTVNTQFPNPTDFLQGDVSFSNYEIKRSIWKYVDNLIPGLISSCIYLELYSARILGKIVKF